MIGIFGTGALIQIDINLIKQILTFILIIIGIVYMSQKKFQMHAMLMGIAVTLHIISFFAVMLPSFNKGYEYFVTATSELVVQTIWIHAVLGAVSMTLGVFLVVAWALRPADIGACSRRKRLMDVVILFWLISLIFGVTTYIIYYV